MPAAGCGRTRFLFAGALVRVQQTYYRHAAEHDSPHANGRTRCQLLPAATNASAAGLRSIGVAAALPSSADGGWRSLAARRSPHRQPAQLQLPLFTLPEAGLCWQAATR